MQPQCNRITLSILCILEHSWVVVPLKASEYNFYSKVFAYRILLLLLLLLWSVEIFCSIKTFICLGQFP